MEIIQSLNPSNEAGRRLTEVLGKRKNQPVLLMLSGGSAFSLLEFVSSEVLGPNITTTVLDERFSTDPTVNNFAQLEVTPFFKLGVERGMSFISTKIQEGDTPAEVTQNWGKALRAWKGNNPDGLVIATLGIGTDGHTAGILPGTPEVDFSGKEWLVSYSVSEAVNKFTERITTNYTFLKNEVDIAVVFAAGEEKHSFIANLTAKECLCKNIPACVFREMKDVTIFTDSPK